VRKLIVLAVCLGWFGSACGRADEVPLIDLARHAQYGEVQISPDGDYLAATAVIKGESVLSIIHLADMKGANVRGSHKNVISWFRWVNARQLLYSIKQQVYLKDQPYETGELFVTDADGKSNKILFGQRKELSDWRLATDEQRQSAAGRFIASLPDDTEHVLIGSYPFDISSRTDMDVVPTAYAIDLHSGSKTRIVASPMRNANFLADHKGSVRVAFGEESNLHHKVYYREGSAADWKLVFGSAVDGAEVGPLAFDRTNSQVYCSCAGANHVGGICLWDVATNQLTTIWSGTESQATALLLTSDGSDAFAVASMPGRTQVNLLDKSAAEAKLLVDLSQRFAGQHVSLGATSRDGRRRIVTVDSDINPGEFYLYDQDKHGMIHLLSRMPWIKPEQMAAMEPVVLAARDGQSLHGYLTKPLGKESAKNLPMVALVHGGPYGIRDEWGFDREVQMLASRGYAVLQVNFRGSGGYGRSFELAGYREWGGKMQDDVTDATRWAIAQGVADPARICIFGTSYGGYAALEAVVKEPDLYRCAIGNSGVYDLRMMFTRGDIVQTSHGENYLKLVLGEDQSDLWSRSPIAHLDVLKAKLMLVAGGADERVPSIQGEKLHDELVRRKIPHEWLFERTEGHGFYDEDHAYEMYNKIIAFLDDNIGAHVAPAVSK
jgi:dipeptidyl aminopeptidase/acylaminoacyl peptidase